jgi:uncharacterized protein YjdB/predicted Ser/Thr protein kinase
MTAAVRASDTDLDLLRQVTAGEYEIAGELGRGGMATVYLARDLSLDRQVAIKLLPPDRKGGLQHAERFKQEARIAASLSHPNIIPIYAVKQAGTALFIVMKYVAGRPLDALVREQGPLRPATVRAVLLQIASALAYAHRHGVVHRDVKPANVMLDPDGTVTVTDFGIAKAAQMDGLTRSGATIGTPTYMSPEQCAGREVTGASDQYSLGILAYELLTGRVPFEQDTVVSIIWAHYHEPPRELLSARPDCPRDLAAAVMRMLAKSPSARWPSMTALADALRRATISDAPAGPGAGARTIEGQPLGRAPGATASARATELVITPAGGALEAGEVVRFSAAPSTERTPSESLGAQWSSSDTSVIRVADDGVVTALRPGRAVLTASAAGLEGSVSVQVTRVGVARLALTPGRHAMTVAEQLQLQLAAQDGFGSRLTGRVVTWSSDHPEVATVSRTGLVEAHAPGLTEISAATGGLSAVALLRVGPPVVTSIRVNPASTTLSPGEFQHFHAVAVNAQGRTIPGAQIAWVTSDASVAAVDDEGTVTGLRAGTARVAATAGGRRTTMAVTVLPRRRSRP